MIIATLPFSLLYTIKVVQEYERAVIFRLGRLLSGGARGPGVFFIIPCVDVYEKIDLRTATYEIPPQEVKCLSEIKRVFIFIFYPFQILTKDSVTVFVNAIMYYKVSSQLMFSPYYQLKPLSFYKAPILTKGEGRNERSGKRRRL